MYKLSKTNTFFSRFEGTREEKNKIFRPKTVVTMVGLPVFLHSNVKCVDLIKVVEVRFEINFGKKYEKKLTSIFDQWQSYISQVL